MHDEINFIENLRLYKNLLTLNYKEVYVKRRVKVDDLNLDWHNSRIYFTRIKVYVIVLK